ncbi:hypothetical protein CJNNKLLH_3104 [Methylorubrum thiocyanatum]|nr:hypothetical protein CJNNKLLH_3104 [Methylorubrum thiocyanatum]
MSLSTKTDHQCIEVGTVARRHLDEVKRRIVQLTALQEELQRLVECHGQGKVAECRVIETLTDYDHRLHEHNRV